MPDQQQNTYCAFVQTLEPTDLHRIYHDTTYGFPIASDDELFGRLLLEMNQAGLSWTTILKKQDNFRKAYDNFNIEKIAHYDQSDADRLLLDAGIIRNRLKIAAAIHNAQVILGVQSEHGSFKQWLDQLQGSSKLEWTKLFKQNFKFTGGEIVNEFLLSTGYVKGAHTDNCPVYESVYKSNPPWVQYSGQI